MKDIPDGCWIIISIGIAFAIIINFFWNVANWSKPMKKQVAFCDKCGTQLTENNFVHLNLCSGIERDAGGSVINFYINYDFCCSCISGILNDYELLNNSLVGRQSLISYLKEIGVKGE